MRKKPTPPLTPAQIQHVRAVLDQALRDTLTDLADRLELEPDPLGIKKSFARGLRPDPLIPPRLDA